MRVMLTTLNKSMRDNRFINVSVLPGYWYKAVRRNERQHNALAVKIWFDCHTAGREGVLQIVLKVLIEFVILQYVLYECIDSFVINVDFTFLVVYKACHLGGQHLRHIHGHHRARLCPVNGL